MRISDLSSDLCSSYLPVTVAVALIGRRLHRLVGPAQQRQLLVEPGGGRRTGQREELGDVFRRRRDLLDLGIGALLVGVDIGILGIELLDLDFRSEERRVGKVCVITCVTRGWAYH